MESPKSYPYPAAEHYIEPRNPHEQADEELRLYRTSDDLRSRLDALKVTYERTPCMQSLREYAEYASAINAQSGFIETDDFNADFYDGLQMGVHINVAPAPKSLQQYVLGIYFVPRDGTDEEAIDLVASWADAGWKHFYDLQDDEFQSRTRELTERLYDGETDALERKFNFILGYTFSCNLVWSAGGAYQSKTKV